MGSTTAVRVASPYLVPSPRACPSLHPAPLRFPPVPLPFPFCSPLLLYARARCGRRRLGQVRLSLGFNIGENTGFYLIVRYPALRGKVVVRGWLKVGRGGGEEDGRERENLDVLGCVHALVFVALYPLNARELCSENGRH